MNIVQLSLAEFFSPCCYGWRRDGVWLYIGQSTNGLARLSSHHVIKRRLIQEHDELIVWRCPDVNELNELERRLIRANKPTLNVFHRDYDDAQHGVSRSVLQSSDGSDYDDPWYRLEKAHGLERCDGKPERRKPAARKPRAERPKARPFIKVNNKPHVA